MPSALTGMHEAVRQIRVARRLYMATGSDELWDDLSVEKRRPFIDQSCQGEWRDDDGYGTGEIRESGNDIMTDNGEFICVDFETANSNLASICQVGTVLFRNGEVVDTFESLVDPEDYFNGCNIAIHGILPKHIIGAPTFKNIYQNLVEQLSNRIVVSHTPFDRSALRQTITRYKLPEINCQWLDSARVVRRTWPIYAREGYGLGSIAAEFGISFEHHNALEDARAAGMVLLKALATSGASLEEWITRSYFPIGSESATHKRDGDPSGAFFGEYLVFTGSLRIPRREAADLAAKIGCTVSDSVTKKTSILVVGDQDIVRLAPGQIKSSKHRKAEELIEEGKPIRIIGETDFMTLCGAER